MKSHEYLTANLFRQHGDRKEMGRLSTITDVSTGQVYVVPRGIEHIHFVYELLGTDEPDQERAAALVPTHIGIERVVPDDLRVVSLLTGISGLEIGLRIRHTREQLAAGHERVRRFVEEGEIERADPLHEDTILLRYACD
jgi:hypothetical protein